MRPYNVAMSRRFEKISLLLRCSLSRLKRTVPAVMILAGAVGLFIWLVSTRPVAPAPPIAEKHWPVKVMQVRLETVRPERTVFATVTVPSQRAIQAPFAGWLEQLPLKPGMTVPAGGLLLKMSEVDAQAQRVQAEADVADISAQLAMERSTLQAQQRLLARKLAKALDVARQQAKVRQLQARLKKAQARLNQVRRDVRRAVLRADRPLRILTVSGVAPARVGAGQTLATAYAPDQQELAVRLPEQVWKTVADEREQLQLKASSGRRFSFSRVDSQRVPLGVRLWFAGDETLRLGDIRRLQLLLPPQSDVAAVPYSALYGADHVYVVKDGRLHRRPVTWLGEVQRKGRTWALVRGLQAGEAVMITHLPNAIDGLNVERVASP